MTTPSFIVTCHVCDRSFVTFDQHLAMSFQPMCPMCAIEFVMNSDELPQVCACPNEVEAASLPIPEGWEHL